MALRASFSPESSISVSSSSSSSRVALQLALDVAVDVLAFAGQFEQRVQVRRSAAATRSSLAMASSSRLRSCITFWLFSGWFQKSGAEICCFGLASCCFLRGRVKDSSARRQPAGGAERTLFRVLRGSFTCSVLPSIRIEITSPSQEITVCSMQEAQLRSRRWVSIVGWKRNSYPPISVRS